MRRKKEPEKGTTDITNTTDLLYPCASVSSVVVFFSFSLLRIFAPSREILAFSCLLSFCSLFPVPYLR